jgi:hypothetical protein
LSAWIFTHRASDNIGIGTLEAQPLGVDGVTVNLLALPVAKRLHIWSTMCAYDGWNVTYKGIHCNHFNFFGGCYLRILIWGLKPRLEMVTDMIWNKNNAQLMRWGNMHHIGP